MHPLQLAKRAIVEHGAIQKFAELAAFVALLEDLNPEVIVEIGSDAGGTLWLWRQLGIRRVIGVDLPRAGFQSGKPLTAHGAEIVHGDSHDPATRDMLEVVLLDSYGVDVLFIDGDHTYEGVRADYELYAPLVRPGGIVAFHDICDHPAYPSVQVRRFWQSLDGRKEEIVTDPQNWGGIGVIRVPALVAA